MMTNADLHETNRLLEEARQAAREAREAAEAAKRELARSLAEVEQRTRELSEALEEQSAIGELLRVINQTTFDLQRVLETLIQKATRLCGAEHGLIYRFDGEHCRLVADYGISPEFRDLEQRNPVHPGRGTLAGRVALEKRTLHIPDALADPEYEWLEGQRVGGYRTMLGVPLLREGALIGVIVMWTSEVKPFTEKQIQLATSFADQAVIAIETVRLFNEVQERTHELQLSLEEVRVLGDVSRAVSSSLDLRQVLDTILRHAVKLSNCDAGAIFELDPRTQCFAGVASHNLSPEYLATIQTTPVDPTRGVIKRATESGQPFQILDVERAHDYMFREVTLKEGFRALLVAPIGVGRVMRGVVVYRRAASAFDDRVVNLLTALANQSKVAIENARLFQDVQSHRVQLEQLSKNLEQLYRLSTAMQEPLSLKEQLTRVLEGARQMGILDRLYVWVVSPGGDKLVNLAGAGFTEEEWRDFEGAEIPLPEAGAMYKAYREGIPLVFNEETPLPPELRLKPQYLASGGMRTKSFLAVPMVARGVTVGLLTGDNKPSRRPIPRETVELLRTFASHAAVAVANARLFQEIEEKSQQLEVATRHKSQFLANMSHELRTPLNAILGYTELILDNIYGEVPDRIHEVLRRVEKSGRHLLGLINDVLDLSKIEAGQLTLALADYSMKDVIQAVSTAVEALAAEKNLALRVALPPDLPLGKGDERRITQVLLNLVGNAIKFTETGEVRVEVAASDGDFVVSVSDTGPGILPADQQRIFEEFQQADTSSTKKKKGTGLGLSIAKRIVELHGGRIWVESTPEQGSTFRFTLPFRVERQREAP